MEPRSKTTSNEEEQLAEAVEEEVCIQLEKKNNSGRQTKYKYQILLQYNSYYIFIYYLLQVSAFLLVHFFTHQLFSFLHLYRHF